jgi:multisubunit Na+/H+ antiporter MnhG subunit
MHRVAMFFGILLIALGLVGYFRPDVFGTVGEKGVSPTALIPAGFGAVLLICGLIVAYAPSTRKHVMHLAAVVGVLGAAGGIMPLARNDMDLSKSGTVAGLLMVILCALFVILCIRSFVLARVASSQGLPDEPWAEENQARQRPPGA